MMGMNDGECRECGRPLDSGHFCQQCKDANSIERTWYMVGNEQERKQ